MQRITCVFSLFLLLFALQINAQEASLLERAQQAFTNDNYRHAAKLAQQAFTNAEKQGDKKTMIEARIIQAQTLLKNTNFLNKNRNSERAGQMLQNASRQARMIKDDSLKAVVQQLIAEFEAQGLLKKEVYSTPNPGGQKNNRPKIRDLVNERIVSFDQYNDSLNQQLLALRAEKNLLEDEINEMSLEQAQQQLILAMKEKTIDSILMARLQDSLLVEQQEEVLQRQEVEIELRETQRNRSIIITSGIITIAIILLWLYFNSRRKNQIIEAERAISDDLLLNILPASVAEELKVNGQANTRYYEQVTVLFADFKGFTSASALLTPQQIVEELDSCFRAFDDIIQKYGLEKIKTIGDAYMCAGGLPEPSQDHAERMVKAAIEMQAWLAQSKGRKLNVARIGIHTGPVIAGVVGARKFAYDIWGETVNIASRIEGKGEAGQVNISQETYQLVKEAFSCTPRGKLPVKGIGEIDMYFVNN
jgi:adenylate cyclase